MTIGLFHFLFLSAFLFALGFVGLVASRGHLVRILIALEVMILAIHLLFVALGRFHNTLDGQIISLFFLAATAAEIVVGLSLLVAFYRRYHCMGIKDMAKLKG